ncbi:M56 family metallopeptidase [Flavobacterium sp. RHBU_3]|uniref:M56 family metallopeptidase n=1 Tax=Flavobacterium sp. RHBU_3 TaxID=3391184 RepID=UPI0039852C39
MGAYILKSAVFLAVLLWAYYLLLSREKMYRFNRFYLLSSLVLSLVLPLVVIPIYVQAEEQPVVQVPVETMQMVTTLPATVAAPEVQQTHYWAYAALAGYILVVTVLAIRFALNILRFYRVKKNNTVLAYNGATLVLLKEDMLPHTFMGNIFMGENEYSRLIEPELLTHELAHVRQRHTLDVLFIELLKTVFWFNPLLYMYKKAIQTNHEFLADEAVIHQHLNIPTYQLLLLDKATPPLAFALASSINFSTTKKRFAMMTKTTTRFKAALLQAATLPITAALVLLFSIKVEAQRAAEPEIKSIKVNKFSPSQLDSVQKVNPGLLDKNLKEGESYTKFETTSKDEKGNNVAETKYVKISQKPIEQDNSNPLKDIKPDQIKSINILSLKQAEFDSLVAANPVKYKGKDLYDVMRTNVDYEDNGTLKALHYYSVRPPQPEIVSEVTEAEYPGGIQVLYNNIMKSMKLPEFNEKGESKIARYILSFDIDKKGRVRNISAKVHPNPGSSFSPEVDADVISQLKKIMGKSPKWEPARQDGKRIASHKDIPFTINIKA